MIVAYCLLIAVGLYIVFVVAPAVVAYKSVFTRKTGTPFVVRDLTKTPLEPHISRISEDFEYFNDCVHEQVSIETFDGERLIGEYYPMGQGKLAICVHGYNSTPLNCFCAMGRYLMELGYDVLLVSQRAHGESEGSHSTLGVLEQFDVICWSRWACEKQEIQKVILAGVSMGCTSVEYAAEKIKDVKVKAMILDCGYISPYGQISTDCRKRHIPAGLLMPVISLCAKTELGIDLKQPVWQSLEKTSIPALFVHGEKDETVPVSETKINYDHCASPKSIYISGKAYHAGTFIYDREEAENKLRVFLETYVERGNE